MARKVEASGNVSSFSSGIWRDILTRDGRLTVQVEGRSMGMGGAFAHAISLEVIPASTRGIHIGAVVAFERNGGWIAHRVVRRLKCVGETRYITCGDGARFPDGDRITDETIVGLVSEVHLLKGRVDLCSSGRRLWGVLLAWRSIVAALLHDPRRTVKLLFPRD